MVVQHNLGLGTDYKPIVQLISNTHALMLYQVANITTNSFKINVVCIDGYKMAMYNGEVKLVWTY